MSTSRGLSTLGSVTLVVVVLTGLIVGGAAVLGAQAHPSGDEILENVETTYSNAETLTGTANVTMSNSTDSATASIEFAADADNRSRVVLTRDGHTLIAGYNGSAAWVFAPETGLLRVWDESDRSGYERVHKRVGDQGVWNSTAWNHSKTVNESVYTATRTGTELLDGTETTVIDIEPTNESLDISATLWVDNTNWTVRKQLVTDGTNQTVIEYRDIRFNVSIHESTFEPPTEGESGLSQYGFEQFDSVDTLRSNTTLAVPRLNSTEFTFERGMVSHIGGQTTVAQEYSNGEEQVMVVVSANTSTFSEPTDATEVTVNGRTANLSSVRGQTAVWWVDTNRTIAVFGDFTEDQILDIASSVE